jgi:hypothetical protein
MKVAEIVEDAGINKGVIVSKNGYTEDAIVYAKYRNIGLVELREITEAEIVEKKEKCPIKFIKSWVSRPEIISVTIVPSASNKPEIEEERINIEDVQILTHTSNVIPLRTILDSFRKELLNKQVGEVYTSKIGLPKQD